MDQWFDNFPLFKGKVSGKITLSYLLLFYAMLLSMVWLTKDRVICVIAMAFSFMGDFSLNYRSLEERTKKDFLYGTICFMVAHFMYVFTYLELIKNHNFEILNAGFFLAATIVVIVLIWFLVMILKTRKTKLTMMHIVGIFYVLIIGLNCSVIFSFSHSIGNIRGLAALGALCFFVSDILIGTETFLGVKSKIVRKFVWFFYPIGQFLIITMG